MINQQTILGNWNEIKGKLQSKWGSLTDDDLTVFNGNVDQLLGAIQKKLARREIALSTFWDKSLQAAQPRSVGLVTRLARGLSRQWNPFRPRPGLLRRQSAKDMRMSRRWSGNGLRNRCWLVSVLVW